MTKQESLKRRIRSRMQKTGERYAAARRVLIAQTPKRKRTWVSQPETSDEAVKNATGRDWEAWCDLIDAWPGHAKGHTAIAAYLRKDVGIDSWWAQGVTVGYERITGLRLPYQMADGTFTASKSRTVRAEASMLNGMLRSADDHKDLFPGYVTDIRSRENSKSIRFAIGNGIALLNVTPKPDGHSKVGVQHTKLPTPEETERWRFFWGEWLEALDGVSE